MGEEFAEAAIVFRPWVLKAVNAQNKRLRGYLVIASGERYVWVHIISLYAAAPGMTPDLPLDYSFVAAESWAELAEHLTLSGHPYRVEEPLYQEVGWAEVLGIEVN